MALFSCTFASFYLAYCLIALSFPVVGASPRGELELATSFCCFDWYGNNLIHLETNAITENQISSGNNFVGSESDNDGGLCVNVPADRVVTRVLLWAELVSGKYISLP